MAGLPHRAFKLKQSKINLLKTRVRSILEHCSLICSSMRQYPRLTTENIQRKFAKWLASILSNLSCKEQCTTLNLEPLWPRPAKANLISFNSFTNVNSCIAAPQFTDQTTCYLQNTKPVVPTAIARTCIIANVLTVNYSYLQNSLPQRLRLLSSSTVAFKNEVPMLLVLPTFILVCCPLTLRVLGVRCWFMTFVITTIRS